MPHVAGHRMGGNYIPPKKNEPKPPKQTNPYVNQSTGKSYVPKGFTGIGGSSVSDRLKQSKKDSRYIAPGAGGTIVTTGKSGISKREDYGATATGGSGDNIVKTTFVDTSGTGTGSSGSDGSGGQTDTEGKTVNDYEYYLLPNGNLDIRKVRRNKWQASRYECC